MRIRQVKPEFWSDPVTARLSVGAQLLYIGLWNLADDAGYLVWDIEQIGAQLFAYESPRKRAKNIATWSDGLISAQRVVVFECGHAKVPTLPEHQRLSGPTKRVLTFKKKHDVGDCPQVPAHPRGSPRVNEAGSEREDTPKDTNPRTSPRVPADARTSPTRKGTVGNGRERNGKSAGARAEGAPRSTDVSDIVEEISARASGLLA